MATMIALVGGQTLPNVLPILHYKPADTLFIYTRSTNKQYENLKMVLEKKNFQVSGIEAEPYAIQAIAQTLRDSLTQMTAPFIFNLTGGTKPMSLAAYQVAAEQNAPVIYLQSENGPNIIYYYTWQNHQLQFHERTLLTEYLSLQEILELHLGPQKDKNNKSGWTINTSIDPQNEGQRFEIAIEKILQDHGYRTLRSVKGTRSQIEIDVIIQHQNQIAIIEAKTGKNGPPTGVAGVKQLSTAMGYLRGTYIQQFLVINGEPTPDQHDLCRLLNITIVSLPGYKQGDATLSQQDENTLLTAVDAAMKKQK